MSPLHRYVPPVQNNQLGTGFGSRGIVVGIVPTVTPLGELLAPRISARGIWAHTQIKYRSSLQFILPDVQFLGIVLQFQEYYNKTCISRS